MSEIVTANTHRWLALFFAFAASMCTLTIFLLIRPGTALDSLWRLNPAAKVAFQNIGPWAVALMAVVGIACASTAVGLWIGAYWGVLLALVIQCCSALGDMFNVFVRHDYPALVGLPIAGAIIWWLTRSSSGRFRSGHSHA